MIREMESRDVAPVIALWHETGLYRAYNDPQRDIAFAVRDHHSTILVAEDDDGRLVGSLMVGEDGHRGWAYYVAVAPNRQGSGLGRRLMEAAEAWLRARGVWKLQLLVRAENTAVSAFYEHLGYHDTRSRCFQKVIEPVESPAEVMTGKPVPAAPSEHQTESSV
ncbi:GNAT family acetyltransferase [Roseospira marina]|uniref:GNAT family acetyltransferase n=1 Tax=Roseospira marina TaxID=140057 RepID=A0A5M6IGI5_9PROT|nr:GNAT family acetyltransferase [Roseospira marina]KAA5606785.1 GNAT family acetyltransferase [Roseospira marina]MBB4313793.1 hypothetical protein [Roseospira marina]MBB5086955.1 hypothetical protein [Roseospira marina]